MPGVVMALVEEAVVQAAFTALPEFEVARHHTESAPEGRQGDFAFADHKAPGAAPNLRFSATTKRIGSR